MCEARTNRQRTSHCPFSLTWAPLLPTTFFYWHLLILLRGCLALILDNYNGDIHNCCCFSFFAAWLGLVILSTETCVILSVSQLWFLKPLKLPVSLILWSHSITYIYAWTKRYLLFDTQHVIWKLVLVIKTWIKESEFASLKTTIPYKFIGIQEIVTLWKDTNELVVCFWHRTFRVIMILKAALPPRSVNKLKTLLICWAKFRWNWFTLLSCLGELPWKSQHSTVLCILLTVAHRHKVSSWKRRSPSLESTAN